MIKLCKSDKRNDPRIDNDLITDDTPVFIVGKPGGIHHARFFSRSYYSVWLSIYFEMLLEFADRVENEKDQKLAKIIKQMTNKKLQSALNFFAIYSSIHLDYVFRTHNKQTIINDYQYLKHVHFKELKKQSNH